MLKRVRQFLVRVETEHDYDGHTDSELCSDIMLNLEEVLRIPYVEHRSVRCELVTQSAYTARVDPALLRRSH